MRWAINKRKKKERFMRGDPMDTNQAEEYKPAEDWEYWEKEWPSEETDERKSEDVNFFSTKGKGSSQGKRFAGVLIDEAAQATDRCGGCH